MAATMRLSGSVTARTTARPSCRRTHAAVRAAPRAQPAAAAAARPDVRAHFFSKFRTDSQDAGIYGSQAREDFTTDDVEHYFNYMGMLAVEGTYDRMEEMLSSGLDPVDVLLLMAASENDVPKVEELLGAGANINIKDSNGRSPLELASKTEVVAMLEEAAKKAVSA